MNIKQSIGIRIRELRLKNSLTQAELAEKVNIATKHQSCIETGKNFPSAELFERYASVFNIDISDLFLIHPFSLGGRRKEIIDDITKQISLSSDYELNIINKFVKSLLNK